MRLGCNQVIDKLNSGKLLTLSSDRSTRQSEHVLGNHAYTVVGYNAATGKFTLFNPWGLDRSADGLADQVRRRSTI